MASGKDVVGKREWWKLWKWKTTDGGDDRVTSLTTVGRCQQEGKPPPSNKGIKKSGSLLECVTPMQVRIHYLLGRIIAIGYSYMYSIQR